MSFTTVYFGRLVKFRHGGVNGFDVEDFFPEKDHWRRTVLHALEGEFPKSGYPVVVRTVCRRTLRTKKGELRGRASWLPFGGILPGGGGRGDDAVYCATCRERVDRLLAREGQQDADTIESFKKGAKLLTGRPEATEDELLGVLA